MAIAVREREFRPRPAGPRYGARRAPRPLPVWWLAAVALSLMVASDYEWRVRSVASSLSGSADIAVLIEIAVYGICGVACAVWWAQATDRRPWPLLWLAGAWVAVSVASAMYAPYRQLALVRAAQLCLVLLVAVVVIRRGRRVELDVFAHAFCALVVASVVLGLFVQFTPTTREFDRFHWIAVHPVVAGSYLAIAFVLLVSYALRPASARRLPRELYVGGVAIIGAAMIANHSRGSVVAAVVGALVALLAPLQHAWRRDVVIVLAVCAAVGLGVYGGTVAEFFDRGDSTAYVSSIESRQELYSAAWDVIVERPFTGYGLTAARGLFFERTGLGGGHNAGLNVLVEAGLAGFVWWLAMLVGIGIALRRLFRYTASRLDAALLTSVFACLVINSLTIDGLGAPANGASTWLLLVLAWVIVWWRDLDDAGYPRAGSPSAGARSGAASTTSRVP
jgi:O-antigen ligase